jgi:hypothetical protein
MGAAPTTPCTFTNNLPVGISVCKQYIDPGESIKLNYAKCFTLATTNSKHHIYCTSKGCYTICNYNKQSVATKVCSTNDFIVYELVLSINNYHIKLSIAHASNKIIISYVPSYSMHVYNKSTKTINVIKNDKSVMHLLPDTDCVYYELKGLVLNNTHQVDPRTVNHKTFGSLSIHSAVKKHDLHTTVTIKDII